ncbi:MAG: PIN domain-containing protein [Dehalococcoidia bacterium]
MEFVDTNIFVRYFTQDNPDMARRAQLLFHDVATGVCLVTTSEGILVETVQVLSSRRLYNLPRTDIRQHLRSVISLPGFKLSHKRMYLRALDLYVAHRFLAFVDVLCMAHTERATLSAIISFDRGFDRVPGVVRREP